jgi:hypothetical protein
MKLDIVVSALLLATDPAAEPAPRAPALETLVARGVPTPAEASGFDDWLLNAFGVPAQAGLPVAPYTLLADGGSADERYWLRADPVHLIADRAELLLSPLAADAIDAAEAQQLGASLAEHFASEAITVATPHPMRWYLGTTTVPQIETVPARLAAGPLTEAKLPSGPDRRLWRRLLTEAQMVLHDHPVNVAREAAGKPVVNGIWPWGGGQLGTFPVTSRYGLICSDSPLAIGLARASGVPVLPPCDSAADILRRPESDDIVLVALDLAARLVRSTHTDRIDALAEFETLWFAPLRNAVAQGIVTELGVRLLAPGGTLGRQVTRSALRKWWRRPHPLSRHA